MKGIRFLIDDEGEKSAVVIDLKRHGVLWEDFFDPLTARSRRAEPRESLEQVKERLAASADYYDTIDQSVTPAGSSRRTFERRERAAIERHARIE